MSWTEEKVEKNEKKTEEKDKKIWLF